MKVVHIATHDRAGGAATAAFRLHSGLQGSGCGSSFYVLRQRSDSPDVVSFVPPQNWTARASRYFRRRRIQRAFDRHQSRRPTDAEPFSDDRTPYARQIAAQIPACDVVNMHWIRGFVDVGAFFDPPPVPVVWTLHDMNAFTGGCHYDDQCGKYHATCGACPQLGSTEQKDLSRDVWLRKAAALNALDPKSLHIVAPSRWLAEEAARSPLLGRFPVSNIPYGLDTTVFAPRDGGALRQALEIPCEARVVLLLADSVAIRRKGYWQVTEVFRDLREMDEVFVLSVGNGALPMPDSVPSRHLGRIYDDHLLSMIYSAADLFLIPSLQDNLPNTVLESLACGTPVVGFDVGGIPDMVRPGVTGQLAPQNDVRALRDAIGELLDDPFMRSNMAESCRTVAITEYALEVQAGKYVDLYRRLLTETSQKATAC